MKRLIKYPFMTMWRLTGPLRRPFVRRFEAVLGRALAEDHERSHFRELTEETIVLMDHMVRELVRLQNKVESLQAAIEDLTPGKTILRVIPDEMENFRERPAG